MQENIKLTNQANGPMGQYARKHSIRTNQANIFALPQRVKSDQVGVLASRDSYWAAQCITKCLSLVVSRTASPRLSDHHWYPSGHPIVANYGKPSQRHTHVDTVISQARHVQIMSTCIIL